MVGLVLLNTTFIEEGGTAYVPLEFYLLVIVLAFAFFFLSIMFRKSDDITGILAAVFFAAASLLTASVQLITIGYQDTVTSPTVIPVGYHPYIPYISYIWGMMFFVSVINVYRVWSRNLKDSEEKKRKEQEE